MNAEQRKVADAWADHAESACGLGIHVSARRNSELAALLRAGIAASEALEEREADMHTRIRAGYDKAVADSWRAANETAWLAAWDAEWRAQCCIALLKRAAVGLQRHVDGRSPMRVPVDLYGDSDMVLSDIEEALSKFEVGR